YLSNESGPTATAGLYKYAYDTNTHDTTLLWSVPMPYPGQPNRQSPGAIAVGSDAVYVACDDGGRIGRYDKATGADLGDLTPLSQAQGLVWGPDGNGDGVQDLYASDYNTGGGHVWRIPTAGPGAGTPVAFLSGLGTVKAIAFGPDGNLYVGERDTG